VTTYKVTPEDFGLARATLSDIKGGDAAYNTSIVREILAGRKGPKRDMVLLNAAAAFRAADKVPDIQTGIAMAEESIDSGKARKKLDLLIQRTNL
jgi:anthranilate phosphoribosyltransferase